MALFWVLLRVFLFRIYYAWSVSAFGHTQCCWRKGGGRGAGTWPPPNFSISTKCGRFTLAKTEIIYPKNVGALSNPAHLPHNWAKLANLDVLFSW